MCTCSAFFSLRLTINRRVFIWVQWCVSVFAQTILWMLTYLFWINFIHNYLSLHFYFIVCSYYPNIRILSFLDRNNYGCSYNYVNIEHFVLKIEYFTIVWKIWWNSHGISANILCMFKGPFSVIFVFKLYATLMDYTWMKGMIYVYSFNV